MAVAEYHAMALAEHRADLADARDGREVARPRQRRETGEVAGADVVRAPRRSPAPGRGGCPGPAQVRQHRPMPGLVAHASGCAPRTARRRSAWSGAAGRDTAPMLSAPAARPRARVPRGPATARDRRARSRVDLGDVVGGHRRAGRRGSADAGSPAARARVAARRGARRPCPPTPAPRGLAPVLRPSPLEIGAVRHVGDGRAGRPGRPKWRCAGRAAGRWRPRWRRRSGCSRHSRSRASARDRRRQGSRSARRPPRARAAARAPAPSAS